MSGALARTPGGEHDVYESCFVDRSLRRHVEMHEGGEDDRKWVQLLGFGIDSHHGQEDTTVRSVTSSTGCKNMRRGCP